MDTGPRVLGAASCKISICRALPHRMHAKTREVSSLHTPAASQQQGEATRLMHSVCDEADHDGITLVLWPNPFGDDIAISRAQLIAWYAQRFGFQLVQQQPALMARMPNSTPMWLKPVASAATEVIRKAMHGTSPGGSHGAPHG